MSAAVKGDTASRAGRKCAPGFRAPEKTAESAALAAAPAQGEPDAALSADDPTRVAENNDARASMAASVTLPATPAVPWMWSNAAAAIRNLPVQGYRLSTVCILEATRANEAGDKTRAHNLLMAASAAVHEQMMDLDIPIAFNTSVVPKQAQPLAPGTPEYREHRAMQIRTYRSMIRGNLRQLRRAQKEHGLPLPPDDGVAREWVDEPELGL